MYFYSFVYCSALRCTYFLKQHCNCKTVPTQTFDTSVMRQILKTQNADLNTGKWCENAKDFNKQGKNWGSNNKLALQTKTLEQK